MRKRATLIDVARLAGVGKTTASDALSGVGRVSAETRQKVLGAAHALQYVPNTAARHLRARSTGSIGLQLPFYSMQSDYSMSFMFGVVQEATRHDNEVTIIVGDGNKSGRAPRVDGLIIGDPSHGDTFAEALLRSGLPTVTLERVDSDLQPSGVVRSLHDEVMKELLDHLEESGARKPALVVPHVDRDWTASLVSGFTSWCAERSIEPLVRYASFLDPGEVARTELRALLAHHPDVDAIVSATDQVALEMIPVLRDLGRIVGEDLLLASCVDSQAVRLAQPSVTSIDLRPLDAGVMCAVMLFELLDGGEIDREWHLPLPIVKRESTRPLAVRNAP